jgi:hypothetical protein
MSRAELLAKLRKEDAKAAIIVTLYKGNPRNLEIIAPSGETLAMIHMESALLSREVSKSHNPRINRINSVEVKQESTTQTKDLANLIGFLLNTEVRESESVKQTEIKGSVIFWFQDLDQGKTLWTHYHAFNGVEIGPRIRVSSISRSIEK